MPMSGLDRGKTARRDHAGRFLNGTAPGPGRPRRAVEKDYLVAISEACPLKIWREIVARAVRDAKKGDGQARAWLSSYLVGKPTEQSKTLRAHAVEELAEVETVARDARIMARLFGDG
jgi:hypothetical protein